MVHGCGLVDLRHQLHLGQDCLRGAKCRVGGIERTLIERIVPPDDVVVMCVVVENSVTCRITCPFATS